MLALQYRLGKCAPGEPTVVFARARFPESHVKAAWGVLEAHYVGCFVCLLAARAAAEDEGFVNILLVYGRLFHEFADF
jgi:hypothetical protein